MTYQLLIEVLLYSLVNWTTGLLFDLHLVLGELHSERSISKVTCQRSVTTVKHLTKLDLLLVVTLLQCRVRGTGVSVGTIRIVSGDVYQWLCLWDCFWPWTFRPHTPFYGSGVTRVPIEVMKLVGIPLHKTCSTSWSNYRNHPCSLMDQGLARRRNPGRREGLGRTIKGSEQV